MRKILIIATLNFLINVINSQGDYFQYHREINAINILIGKESFGEAVEKYEQIFAQYEYVFLKDIIIAAQVASLVNNKQRTYDWLSDALTRGYTCDCVKRLPAFKEFVKTVEWEELESKSKEFRIKYAQSINLEWHKEFHRRFKEEQENKSSENQDIYIQVLTSNYNRIKFLMDSIPFPSERIIGIDNEKIYPTSSGGRLKDCEAGNSKVIPTLLHYDNPIADIGYDKFLEAIRLGYLHPNEFASIYTFEVYGVSRLKDGKHVNSPQLPEFYFNFPFGRKLDDTKRVNSDRAKFSIATIESRKKMKTITEKYRLKLDFGYQ